MSDYNKQKLRQAYYCKGKMVRRMSDCDKCGLRYSSYCIGCKNVIQGLGVSHEEYLQYLKNKESKDINEKQNCN